MGKNYNQICQFVFVCNGKDCRKCGGKEIAKAVKKFIKDRDLEDHTKMVKTQCTDRCKEGPVMIVGTNWLTKVKEDRVSRLLDKYLLKN